MDHLIRERRLFLAAFAAPIEHARQVLDDQEQITRVIAIAAPCRACNREQVVATSCTVAEVALANGRVLPRVRFFPGHGASPDERCADCNVAPGGLHRLDCGLELCPACGRQARVCGFRV